MAMDISEFQPICSNIGVLDGKTETDLQYIKKIACELKFNNKWIQMQVILNIRYIF